MPKALLHYPLKPSCFSYWQVLEQTYAPYSVCCCHAFSRCFRFSEVLQQCIKPAFHPVFSKKILLITLVNHISISVSCCGFCDKYSNRPHSTLGFNPGISWKFCATSWLACFHKTYFMLSVNCDVDFRFPTKLKWLRGPHIVSAIKAIHLLVIEFQGTRQCYILIKLCRWWL